MADEDDQGQPSRASALDQRQASFVAAYLGNGGNATRAAVAAGYSPATAASQGSRLLKRTKIARELARARAGAADVIDASAERVITEIARCAFLDPASLFTVEGELLPIHRLPRDVRAALAGFDVEERTDRDGARVTTRRLRFVSKAEALRLLAQVRGLLVERVQHEGPASVQVLIGVAPPRAVTPAVTPGELGPAAGRTLALGEKEGERSSVVQPGNDAHGQGAGRPGEGEL